MHELLHTTQISKRWNSASPTFWTEVELLHRTPDNVKAKIITRSCHSLKTIKFKFYFDYLLAFKSLQHCSKLKHLTIGEGGLTWIAAANASSTNVLPLIPPPNGTNGTHNTNGNNSSSTPAQNNTTNTDDNNKPPTTEDADAKLLVAKATNAANMTADAANEANTAANAANHSVHIANNAVATAAALLATLPSSAVTASLQNAINAVTAAVQAASTAANAASTAANSAASAANASSVAAGLAGHVVRYNTTTYLNQNNTNNNSPPQAQPDANSQNRGSRSPRSATAANSESQLNARQIKTLRITSGRSDKKIIPEYKHLYLFNNLRELSLDGGISPPHLEGVILSARLLRSLRINCSESGNELFALRHASGLEVLKLHYFSHLFVGSVCNVPSLTELYLQYTNHSPQIGLQQLAAALPKLHCFHLQHPSFAILPPETATTSELNFLCSIKNLDELDLHLSKCSPDSIGDLPLTSLRKLGTSMVLPIAFVQKQSRLTHISLSSNHLALAENAAQTLIPLDLPNLIPQVQTLFLDGINLTKSLAAILARLRLRRLRIHCEEVNKDELEVLLQSKTLELIDMFVDYAGESSKVMADMAKTNSDSLRRVRYAVVKRNNLLYF